MLKKDIGLILKQIKYNDKSNIITIFTKNLGKNYFILYGINSERKGKLLRNIINPLYPVNIVYYYKENQNLNKIKEISITNSYRNIISCFNKKAILLFLSEILDNSLMENMQDIQLFDFIIHSLQLLDITNKNYSNFHILFIIKFLSYLGIYPINNFSPQNSFFNIIQGKFSQKYESGLSLDAKLSKTFSQLLNMSITEFDKITLSRSERNILLHFLIDYLKFHLEQFKSINSLEILEEIFN